MSGVPPRAGSDAGERGTGPGRRPADALVAFVTTRRLVAAALIVPFVVAAWRLVDDDVASVYDLALMELRVRDVGTAHTPLIGLPGRLGVGTEVGNHPGPLAFYVLAIPYRLLGGRRWAIGVATLVVHLGALLLAVALAWRSVGRVIGLAVAVAGLVLAQAWGFEHLAMVWNPYVPWYVFFAYLVTLWLIVAGHWRLAPLAALLASIAAQTHIPYLPVCALTMAAVCVSLVVVATRRRTIDVARRRAAVRSLVATAATTSIAWLPPLIQELGNGRGNMSLLVDRFTGGAGEPAIGWGRALKELAIRVDPWLLSISATRDGSQWHDPALHGVEASWERGTVVLVVWLGLAVIGCRRHPRTLRAINVTLGGVLVAAVIGTSRIQGEPLPYLLHLEVTTSALVLLATGWMAVVVVGGPVRRIPASAMVGWRTVGTLAGGAVLVMLSLRLTWWPDHRQLTSHHGAGRQTARLAEQTIAELRAGTGAALPDAGGRYVVHLGYGNSHGLSEYFGLIGELDRAGIAAYAPPNQLLQNVGDHRVSEPTAATAQLVIASAGSAARWLDDPDARLIATDVPAVPGHSAFADLVADLSTTLRRTYGAAEAERLTKDPFNYIPPADASDGWMARFEQLRRSLPTMHVFVTPPSTPPR